MKKTLAFILTLLLAAVLMTCEAYADEIEENIKDSLSKADLDGAEYGLSELGISADEPESVKDVTPGKIAGYVSDTVKAGFKRPLRLMLTVMVFAAVSAAASALSFRTGVYGELFVLICFIAISPGITESFGTALSGVKGCTGFMMTYIPVFASAAAASGNIASALSYNAVLMYFCEGAAALTSAVLRPILCCMLVLSAVQAIDPGLSSLTSTLKNIMTTVIGFVMTIFLGIIGLQTTVGRATEGLALKAGKYAVSSFVPVIGYSLSESYKAVGVSLSAIRTAIGGFGIAVMFVFMLSPIVSALIYKSIFKLCGWICRLTGADGLGCMMYGLADVYGFLSTVLIFFMLMLVVATGMLILLGGAMLV